MGNGQIITVCGICLVLSLVGCTAAKPGFTPPILTETKTGDQVFGWWAARFKVNWPQEMETQWYIDVMLAQQVITPVLNVHGKQILLWRFHRRAARDKAGHQFSFLFYCSSDIAKRIYEMMRINPLLDELLTEGSIKQVHYDNTEHTKSSGIASFSDSNWSKPVQNAWPYFIMGVSRTWLELIQEHVASDGDLDGFTSIEDAKAYYKNISDSVTRAWQQEGRHAFLHHLNAVFGYQPLIYYEKRYINF